MVRNESFHSLCLQVECFQAHAGVVCSMAMHPKGECLLTSSVDGDIKVWV